jgi:hypothetical protein
MPYFFTSSTFNIVASRPFKDEMLSANLQLIGMLGASEPTYLTLEPYSTASGGILLDINGLFSIPSISSLCASLGIEYVFSILPILSAFDWGLRNGY